jgi:hypothetical protein
MKNSKAIIAVIIVIILIIIGGAYLMLSSRAKVQPQTQTAKTQTAKPQQTTNSLKGTILGLLSGGKTVSCQVTYPDNKGTGTFYVSSDKKFAGDFVMKGTDGKETNGHVVSDGTYMYIWSSGLSMGMKMSLAAAKNTNQVNNQSFNVNSEVTMNCSNWTVDPSKFTVPSNIQFRDVSQLLQQVPAQGTAPKTVAPQTGTGASPCDQITNPTAKAACTKAMNGQGY